MNLRWFHALLILCSAALGVLFGLWCLSQRAQGDGIGLLVAGVTSFVVSLGLIVYDSWFLRTTRMLR
ncbi:MAG: hypothetical protein ABMA15_16640 [Vicinamibacterales bacterium]